MDFEGRDMAFGTGEVPMIEPEIVRQMRDLSLQGWGSRRISRQLGVARNTVRRYLRGDEMAESGRRPGARRLDEVGVAEAIRLFEGVAEGNAVVVRDLLRTDLNSLYPLDPAFSHLVIDAEASWDDLDYVWIPALNDAATEISSIFATLQTLSHRGKGSQRWQASMPPRVAGSRWLGRILGGGARVPLAPGFGPLGCVGDRPKRHHWLCSRQVLS